MSKIRVKNFGPIKDGFNENDGFLDIKKVTVFIGNQGSGKSTVAKLISTCKWLEKAMHRGDVDKNISEKELMMEYFFYQRIQNYSIPSYITEIEFLGKVYEIKISSKDDNWKIETKESDIEKYKVPKIMYVPAERNFLSIIKDAFDIKGLPGALFSFAEELKKTQKEIGNYAISLPIDGYKYFYDNVTNVSFLLGNDYVLNLAEASSGLQSLVPLYLVSRSLISDVESRHEPMYRYVSPNQWIRMNNEINLVLNNSSLSQKEIDDKSSEIIDKYHNSCFINIVEEPEQNLFPESQRHILNSLLGFANKQEANELLMTTHSPYIINYLSIAIQGKHLLDKINASPNKEKFLPRLNAIVPIEACVAAEDVAIFQFQNDGSICRLGDYEGIPSDKNYLNQSLAEGNQLFDALLELEEEL